MVATRQLLPYWAPSPPSGLMSAPMAFREPVRHPQLLPCLPNPPSQTPPNPSENPPKAGVPDLELGVEPRRAAARSPSQYPEGGERKKIAYRQ
nr:unnamed protein product [Digitaria exilis]